MVHTSEFILLAPPGRSCHYLSSTLYYSVLYLESLLDLLQPQTLDVLLAHLELLDLARDRRGEPLHEADVLGDLKVGHLALAELLDVVRGEVIAAGPELDYIYNVTMVDVTQEME